eukprot:1195387-Prorocentrum_minimum.AAC.3
MLRVYPPFSGLVRTYEDAQAMKGKGVAKGERSGRKWGTEHRVRKGEGEGRVRKGDHDAEYEHHRLVVVMYLEEFYSADAHPYAHTVGKQQSAARAVDKSHDPNLPVAIPHLTLTCISNQIQHDVCEVETAA